MDSDGQEGAGPEYVFQSEESAADGRGIAGSVLEDADIFRHVEMYSTRGVFEMKNGDMNNNIVAYK